jgi:hypothetical protein
LIYYIGLFGESSSGHDNSLLSLSVNSVFEITPFIRSTRMPFLKKSSMSTKLKNQTIGKILPKQKEIPTPLLPG